MSDNTVDVTLTDIPYGEVNREDNGLKKLSRGDADIVDFDLIELLEQLKRVTSQTIYIFCGFRQISTIISELGQDMSIRTLVWEKPNPSPLNCHKLWLSNIELIGYGKFPNATFNGGYESSVLKHKAGSSKLHPTMKPVELLKHLVKMSSNKGDLIFDPFLGSGSTAIAAKSLGRKYIGFEKKREYYDIAKNRISQVQMGFQL